MTNWAYKAKRSKLALENSNKHMGRKRTRPAHWGRIIGADCPDCGAQTVKRTGKYGSFFGCDKWPRCKYTYEVEPGTP